MADIIAEINTIGDLIAPASDFTRFYKQSLPEKYVANTVGIRWQGDTNESLTNVMYSVGRTYQVVYFGNNEVNCIQIADKIRTQLNNTIKTRLRGSDDYMTLGPLSFSAPYKTETDGVYAIVGVLPVTIYAERPQQSWEPIENIETNIESGSVGYIDGKPHKRTNTDLLTVTKDDVTYEFVKKEIEEIGGNE